jgi:hypothetical protein
VVVVRRGRGRPSSSKVVDKTLPSTSFLARVGLAGLGGVGVVDWVRRALMRKVSRGRVRSKQHVEMVEADERVVYAVKFAIGMTVCLSCLEAAHMAFLQRWNSEIFVVISSLITFVSGVIIGQKAS